MLSILREHRPYYFWVLVAQMVVSGVAIAWWEVVYGGHASGVGAAIAVALKMSALIPLWGVMAVIIVDSGRRVMVLLPDGRAKIMAKGEAKGRAEARAEARAERERELAHLQAAWVSWHARWKEHHDRGEPFDEPPPMPRNGTSGNNGASGSNGASGNNGASGSGGE